MNSRINAFVLIFFVLIGSAFAQKDGGDELQRAGNAFGRYMESAHPTPVAPEKLRGAVPLSDDYVPSFFLNVNTIETETETYQMQNESSVAVNPRNPKNLISSAVDYRAQSSTWIYVSDDGGRSWRNMNLGKPFDDWRSTNDPSVAYDSDGWGYLVYGGFGETNSGGVLSGENGVFIARSSDEGETWEAHIPIILHEGEQTLDSTFEDKYYISVDNSVSSPYRDHLYVPWKRMTPRDSATQIVISKSIDKGLTWSEPVAVSERLPGTTEDTTFGQSFPLAACGPDGEVYLVWNHGIVHGVGFAKSTDGGLNWSAPEIIHYYESFGDTIFITGQGYRHGVKGKVRAEAYPVIVTDVYGGPYHGNVYVCWAADKVPNIYFSKSMDGGVSWSDPVIVHSTEKNDQFWPWMSIDPKTGDLGIMYFDSRNDPDNILVECFVSYSSDGGETWTDRRAADFGSDLRLNPFTDNSFAGDYSGCAFWNGTIFPTWIDMRHAISNIVDSDVYTAIVNTRAPNPPENFAAVSIGDQPAVLDLSWDAPTERAFGQPLGASEFVYVLYRNGDFLTELPGETTEYKDNGLTPFDEYEYSIATIAGADSSTKQDASAIAGGARQPMAPEIISFSKEKSNPDIKLEIQIPSFRTDGETAIQSLEKIEIYRDGALLETIPLTPSDTGKVIEYTGRVDVEGFYDYQCRVFDNPPLVGQLDGVYSELETYFCGDISDDTEYEENFDETTLMKFKVSEGWQVSDRISYSGNNCITIAPNGDYRSNQFDTLIAFPFIVPGDEQDAVLSFYHAAILHKSDSANVEYSKDGMNTWELLGTFNKDMNDLWKDRQLKEDDMFHQEYKFMKSDTEGDTVFVRFRFRSNGYWEETGWFIDDLQVGRAAQSVETSENYLKPVLYPNPAHSLLKINTSAPLNWHKARIRIIDILGRPVIAAPSKTVESPYSTAIDVGSLTPGAYFILIGEGKKLIKKRFTIVK